ncbi:hypothetical protein HAX54_024336 [Datura stramonium]|uniref:Uncharacterized protein n=1 Tax=Datura stramonium TaxID=4076 RepID=A0ABS8S5P0_DATST|nr:hypothetical protein [Datura stramonium]
MGRRRLKTDYEEVRKAQILENQVLFSLQFHRLFSVKIIIVVAEFRVYRLDLPVTEFEKPWQSSEQSEKRKYNKIDYCSAPLRRSDRLKGGKSSDNKLGVKKSRAAQTEKMKGEYRNSKQQASAVDSAKEEESSDKSSSEVNDNDEDDDLIEI